MRPPCDNLTNSFSPGTKRCDDRRKPAVIDNLVCHAVMPTPVKSRLQHRKVYKL